MWRASRIPWVFEKVFAIMEYSARQIKQRVKLMHFPTQLIIITTTDDYGATRLRALHYNTTAALRVWYFVDFFLWGPGILQCGQFSKSHQYKRNFFWNFEWKNCPIVNGLTKKKMKSTIYFHQLLWSLQAILIGKRYPQRIMAKRYEDKQIIQKICLNRKTI